MKINKLKINNFGNLSNKEINLNDNINIIYGKNESGKSTLLKFITAMFYGLSKNKNGKFISDYERYTPWNEGEFSGKISYEMDNGNKFEVFREFKKKNAKIYNENMQDISLNFNIDKTEGNKFFYDQTNVDEELFLSTIVSEQEEVKLDEKEQSQFIQKLSNITTTGEDNLSFTRTMNKLNKRQTEEIGSTRTQDRPINIVTKRMEEIENEKEYLANFIGKQVEMEKQIQEIESQVKEDEYSIELLRKMDAIQEKEELDKQKIQINVKALKEYENQINKLNENKENIKEQGLIPTNKFNKAGLIICIIIWLIAICSIIIIKNDIISAISIVSAIIISIYIGYKQYKGKMRNKALENHQNVENIKIESEVQVLEKSKQDLQDQINKMEKELKDNHNKEIEKIRNTYIGILPIKHIDELLGKEMLKYEISKYQNELSEKKVEIHSINLEKNNVLSKLENLSELEEEYASLKEQYDELCEKNDSINLVKENLEKAYEIMKQNVTPIFTNNLSKTIDKISNGKYKNVKINDEKGLIVETENGKYISCKHLSIGTIDQLYLSLRIGAGENISNEKLPIILDEVFAYWDDDRLSNILKYMNEELKSRQIILFSCTNREKEMLEKLNIPYNYINLNA